MRLAGAASGSLRCCFDCSSLHRQEEPGPPWSVTSKYTPLSVLSILLTGPANTVTDRAGERSNARKAIIWRILTLKTNVQF